MRFPVWCAAAFTLALSSPADAQVMARGYYNHLDSRISAYFPGVTTANQVTVEDFNYTTERGPAAAARRFTHRTPDGIRYTVTSVNFKPNYPSQDVIVQASMAHAATNYRKLGEVTFDAGHRTDRIPAHQLNIRLPNQNMLFVLLILHQDDQMDERRLVIAEAETPPRRRQPGLFLASVGIINPQYFGTSADHTLWRVRYTPAGPPLNDPRLVATQPWGLGEFQETMSVGGEAIPQQ
jgi:hypothetical protein